MKIGFVIDRYPPRPHSSIGLFVQNMARELFKRGHQVSVVELGESEEESTDDGVRVTTLRRSNLRYVGNLISRLRLRNLLISRVKDKDIEVIEVPDYSGFIPFGLNRCPVVVRLHQTATGVRQINGERLARGLYYYERRNLIANPNWIAVSHHILHLTKSIFGVSPRRSTVIYNPMFPLTTSLPEMADLPDNYILYAGEICRRKGSLVLAEAVRDLMVTRPDLHLVYVGSVFKEDGRLVSDDIRKILGSELAKRVCFLGRVERAKVLACMARARVFAFPSRFEALGLVVLEAMSCGAPVVCMNCPPGPEMVEDGVTGLLADPTSPEDFREKICRILDDPVLAKRVAGNAQGMVAERFSVEKCVEATERFYEECLKN